MRAISAVRASPATSSRCGLGNVAGLFTDHVVLVGHNRNLRQVCYDDDLMRGGKIGQHTSKSAGRGAADTSIDLVKHQRIDTAALPRTTLLANMTRLSSPPDAMRRRGRGVKPAPLRYSSS